MVLVDQVRPPFRRRLSRWPGVRGLGAAHNADRLLNRFWDYPKTLAQRLRREPFDLFHLVDHRISGFSPRKPRGLIPSGGVEEVSSRVSTRPLVCDDYL